MNHGGIHNGARSSRACSLKCSPTAANLLSRMVLLQKVADRQDGCGISNPALGQVNSGKAAHGLHFKAILMATSLRQRQFCIR